MTLIDRRQFLLSTTALAAGCAAGVRGGGEDRPNLLIIHTDQQNCWTLGCYGSELIKTPHIDSIAAQGVLCRNHFANSAVCTPSRGTLLTGRYPHAHGAYRNDVPLGRGERTLATILAARGYATGYAGKWHLDGKPKPGWMVPERSMGFADCRYMFNRGHWKRIEERPEGRPKVHPYKAIGDEGSYTTDWLGGKAIEFVRAHRDRPFGYMLSIPDPHSPYTVRPPYDTLFDPEDMPVAPTLFQEDLPRWARPKRKRKVDRARRERVFRKRTAGYLGMVKCIDDTVGRILACLREEGLLERTLVVFTTDHGDYMGEHGLIGKNNIYETAYRIPFLVRWPRALPTGREVEACWANVDVLPTLLALMGVPAPAGIQGRDASRLLQGRDDSWRDEAFLHHPSFDRAGLFTPDYELALVRNSDHVLFDRRRDPHQVRNIYADSAHRPRVRQLLQRIVDHHRATRSPAAEWLARVEV